MLIHSREPLVISEGTHDAWDLVRRSQQSTPAGWLVTQPAHSAVSGEIAARLSADHFPGLTDPVRHCIALHDTGWSAFDAQQIDDVRSRKNMRPVSFISETPDVFLKAWTASIDVAERICAEGGHMVSRHFDSLGKEPGNSLSPAEEQNLSRFHHTESRRQQRLATLSGKSAQELEALLQANRFCDLLSLFLCANIELRPGAIATFAQRATPGGPYRLTFTGERWSFNDDTPFREPAELSFSGVSFGAKPGGGWFHTSIA
ncbi:MAG: hypothetical protein NVS9B15_15180 [Acidobacteriaceae bacterium]